MDLARVAHIHNIGALSPIQVTTLLTDVCARFGVDPTGNEIVLEELAHPCEGWPRHLHLALQVLTSSLVRPDVAGKISRVDFYQVIGDALKSRSR